MTGISCGERLVQLLERYGIDTAFGIPGNHTVQLYRGLEHSRIRHISPRHEQGAAFMADGYARATGKPAACFLISGPGLGNAITPMMQALADSIPMLVVTAVASRSQLAMGEGRLHELPDQRALARQCTRFSHTLMDPQELPKVLARAFAVFDSARPGPVHIELPLDVITANAEAVDAQPWPRVNPPAPGEAALATLRDRLLEAERPCVIAGGGAVGASAAVRQLVEHLDVPLVTTVNGKGLLPPEHPLLLGGSPSLAAVRSFLAESDLVLALGTEFGETDYDMLFLGALPELPWLARVDIDPEQFSRNLRADLAICADTGETIAALLRQLPDGVSRDGAARVEAGRKAITQESHYHADMDAFFACVTQALPDVCLVGDSTLPTYYAVWQYLATGPRRYFHSATGAGTLGYAIPAAMGARRGLEADTPVVALIGDGAAQFTFMELASAVQENLPVIVLLWNNHGYREIKAGMVAAEIEPLGVDIDAPDFLAAARALGCEAHSASTRDELDTALRQAHSTRQVTVIELHEPDWLSTPGGQWY